MNTKKLLEGWQTNGKPCFDKYTIRMLCHFIDIENKKYHKEQLKLNSVSTSFLHFNGLKTKCFNPTNKYKILDYKDEHYLITDDEGDAIWVTKQNFEVIT